MWCQQDWLTCLRALSWLSQRIDFWSFTLFSLFFTLAAYRAIMCDWRESKRNLILPHHVLLDSCNHNNFIHRTQHNYLSSVFHHNSSSSIRIQFIFMLWSFSMLTMHSEMLSTNETTQQKIFQFHSHCRWGENCNMFTARLTLRRSPALLSRTS